MRDGAQMGADVDTTGNRDYKYVIQDISHVYLGAKYTYEDMLEDENVPFKWKALIQRYIAPELDLTTAMESHLYYMEDKGFLYQALKQLKLVVKVSVLKDKKTLSGKIKWQYETENIPFEKFVAIAPADKEKQGMMIQEIAMSKMALMAISL